MIIAITRNVNTVSQSVYDAITDSIDPALCTCPKCRHTGMCVHAYYSRKLKTREGFLVLIIKRLRCNSCGCTHAILLDLIVPYSWISREDTLAIISSSSPDQDRRIMEHNILIDESDIYRVRRNYNLHWKQRLLSFSIPLSSSITEQCIEHFHRAFMQIPCTLSGIYRCLHIVRQDSLSLSF